MQQHMPRLALPLWLGSVAWDIAACVGQEEAGTGAALWGGVNGRVAGSMGHDDGMKRGVSFTSLRAELTGKQET